MFSGVPAELRRKTAGGGGGVVEGGACAGGAGSQNQVFSISGLSNPRESPGRHGWLQGKDQIRFEAVTLLRPQKDRRWC